MCVCVSGHSKIKRGKLFESNEQFDRLYKIMIKLFTFIFTRKIFLIESTQLYLLYTVCIITIVLNAHFSSEKNVKCHAFGFFMFMYFGQNFSGFFPFVSVMLHFLSAHDDMNLVAGVFICVFSVLCAVAKSFFSRL